MNGYHGVALALPCLAIATLLAILDVSDVSRRLLIYFDNAWYAWYVEDCNSPVKMPAGEGDTSVVTGKINVVYAAGSKEFPGLSSSIISLSRHLDSPGDCVIHIIVYETDIFQAESLLECLREELGSPATAPTLKLHELRPLPFNFTSFREVWEDVWPSGEPFLTPMHFVQIYLPEYFPTEPRVVWLDPDTVVQSDIGKLYRTPMSTALAAALDMRWITWNSGYIREIDGLNGSWWRDLPDLRTRTLNAGVLVLDLDRWRAEGISGKLEAWVRRASGVKVARLALNLEFHNGFDVLDWRWNVMGLMALPPQRCLEQAHVLHWAETIKPWSENVPRLPARLQKLYHDQFDPFRLSRDCSWRAAMLDTDVGFDG